MVGPLLGQDGIFERSRLFTFKDVGGIFVILVTLFKTKSSLFDDHILMIRVIFMINRLTFFKITITFCSRFLFLRGESYLFRALFDFFSSPLYQKIKIKVKISRLLLIFVDVHFFIFLSAQFLKIFT